MNNNTDDGRMMKLDDMSRRMRADIIKMVHDAGSGHIGASLSVVDILTVLYSEEINFSIDKNGRQVSDNKLILSKGHACPALYACLADKGIIPRNDLNGFRKVDSVLQGHPSLSVPGVDAQSGSLGQGLSIANGMAMASKMNNKDMHAYVIMGDGELQEGQIWEAARTSVSMKLNNVIAIIDVNGLQTDGPTPDGHETNQLEEKWDSFGWNVIKIDAHDFESIRSSINLAKKSERPTVILARTVKGKGISFMENNPEWHGRIPTCSELDASVNELMRNKEDYTCS